MKNCRAVRLDIAQSQLTVRELELEVVETNVRQECQRWYDPRRPHADMHGKRRKTDRCLYMSEPSRSSVLDVLDLLPAARAFGVVARSERRSKCG